MTTTPEDIRYHPEHMWARLEGTRARIGITDYAQDALSAPWSTWTCQSPAPGCSKASRAARSSRPRPSAELIASVTGTVVERNDTLRGTPSWSTVTRTAAPGCCSSKSTVSRPAFVRAPVHRADGDALTRHPDKRLELAPARPMPHPPALPRSRASRGPPPRISPTSRTDCPAAPSAMRSGPPEKASTRSKTGASVPRSPGAASPVTLLSNSQAGVGHRSPERLTFHRREALASAFDGNDSRRPRWLPVAAAVSDGSRC
jgi:glycine cleavage system H lipoate-binding protein